MSISSAPSTPRPGLASTDSSQPLLRLSQTLRDIRRDSWATGSDSPYPAGPTSRISTLTLSEKFTLGPDPSQWGFDVSRDGVIEPDDDLHDPAGDKESEPAKSTAPKVSFRGLANVGCLSFLCAIFLALFIGYPVITYANTPRYMPRINSTGQVPSMGNFGLIDFDTPSVAYTVKSKRDGTEMVLVFSDEFNVDGRTFYPGDDPYWEAEDLHYWATNNREWYDPEAITTANGKLVVTFSQKPTHGLSFQGGLLSSWNKFCFTGGYIEAAVQLPGLNNVAGMWPAIWTMGNLGRAGYGATLDGMWPYTYDSCDVGTAPNQTRNGLPLAAMTQGDHLYNFELSYLPGQKLSRCTCNGEDHPGPKHLDGTYVGRAAPEIDMIEAQVGGEPKRGEVSQSAQWAPFNHRYSWDNSSDNMIITDPSISHLNDFVGSITQQATSVVTDTNQRCYEYVEDCYSVYGFEYKPGYDNAYIAWVSDSKISWTINVAGVGPDPTVEISGRPIPQEPMYMIVNLGMSENFGAIDFEHLIFPNHLRVDYVRVYQRPDSINIGCNPKDFPTQDYINKCSFPPVFSL
ncbi:glycoside hydrolase family 16 protein [Cyathus striatus]|nr:glycoside hydrolase family 16 protein [Cyathus striatus]